MFGDTMNVECSEDKIQLCSESMDTGKMNVEIPIDDVLSFAIEEDREFKYFIQFIIFTQYLHV